MGKRQVGLAAGIVALCAAVWFFASDDSPPERVTPVVYVVSYEVTGSMGYASLTMATPTGTQQIDADLPLTAKDGATGLRFTTADLTWSPYLSAQKPDELGSITCQIKIDGTVISTNTSTAAYGIATCHR